MNGTLYTSITPTNKEGYYHHFGSQKPGRNDNPGEYRYGFNGKETESEITGTESHLDYGARIYDSRIGRFFSVDPVNEEYPEQSPYCYAANNPIYYMDEEGMAPIPPITFKGFKGKGNLVIVMNDYAKEGRTFKPNIKQSSYDEIYVSSLKYAYLYVKTTSEISGQKLNSVVLKTHSSAALNRNNQLEGGLVITKEVKGQVKNILLNAERIQNCFNGKAHLNPPGLNEEIVYLGAIMKYVNPQATITYTACGIGHHKKTCEQLMKLTSMSGNNMYSVFGLQSNNIVSSYADKSFGVTEYNSSLAAKNSIVRGFNMYYYNSSSGTVDATQYLRDYKVFADGLNRYINQKMAQMISESQKIMKKAFGRRKGRKVYERVVF